MNNTYVVALLLSAFCAHGVLACAVLCIEKRTDL